MNTKPKPEEYTLCKWVYSGFCILNTGKKGHLFYSLEDENDRHIFAAAGRGWLRAFLPGHVYEIKKTEDGEKVVGTPKWLSPLDDEQKRLQLQLKHKSIIGHFQRETLQKKLGDDDQILLALKPIKKAMRETNFVGKAAIKAYVLHYLDRP